MKAYEMDRRCAYAKGSRKSELDRRSGWKQKQEIRSLIIDLRDNSGGSYEAAAEILDTLVSSGRLMIVTDKNGEQTVKYMSDNSSVELIYSVLVDENTEGAAELFASALFEHRYPVPAAR